MGEGAKLDRPQDPIVSLRSPASRWYRFGPFRLDAVQHLLYRGEELLALTPKVVQTLEVLLANAGSVIRREDLMAQVWPDVVVLDSNLTQNIWILRKILERDGVPAIQTHARRGYRFLLPVEEDVAPEAHPGPGAVPIPSLPHPSSPLIGRDRELAFLRTALCAEHARCVTLTGPGGVGKTRLALEAAALWSWEIDPGVRWFDLSSCTSVSSLLDALAKGLGVEEDPGQPLEPLLIRALVPRRLLLVLDNLEQIPGAADPLSHLLESVPHLKLLATSRIHLQLRSEQVLHVEPLPLPSDPTQQELSTLEASEAVQLFLARARARCPDFPWDERIARTVGQICVRLDGLPLALELAAARARTYAPSDLLQALDRSLAFLDRGPRDAPVRHRSLKAALDWSVDLLTPEQRGLLSQLALCEGSFSADLAQALAGRPIASDLEALCDHHLLQPRHGSRTRFAMLRTVREFALERPPEEAEGVRRRLADHLLDLTESRAAELYTLRRREAMASFQEDLPLARSALATFAATDPDRALRLAAAMAPFWHLLGHWQEALDALPRHLEAASQAAPEYRGRAWLHLGRLRFFLGAESEAEAALRLALEAAQRARDPLLEVWSRESIAQVQLKLGRDSEGRASLQEALPLARRCGHPFTLAEVQMTLGTCLAAAADLSGAEAHLQEAWAIARTLEAAPLLLRLLYYRAGIALLKQDAEAALRCCEEALLVIPEAGDASWGYHLLEMHGRALVARGRTQEGAAFICESLKAIGDLGSLTCIPHGLEAVARLHGARGEHTSSARFLGAAQGVCCHLGIAMLPVERSLYRQSCEALPPPLREGSEWREGAGWSPEEGLALGREACGEGGL
jgi:predicted ATPase/DNA-binding winged helix-turn-helix (wHTH) protein